MTLPESAATIEVVWSSLALLGAGVAAGLLAHIWQSYQTVADWIAEGRTVAWGPRHRFVVGFGAGIVLLFLVWAGFVALGANAMVNPAAADAERQAASQRGGWILVSLLCVLLGFQLLLTWAWVSVGRPTLSPDTATRSPVALLFRAIDLGRAMGHEIANDAQGPVLVLDEIANDGSLPADMRRRAAEALAALERMIDRTRRLHETIKALEGAA